MRMQNVPLDQIVWNPWRDKDLFPIDPEHVTGLRASMKEHGFFSSVKGRRRNGKVELGCGHARFEAAKRATFEGEKIETIPIFIGDIDDDGMLRLMTDENALQAGSTAGAVINEVAAVTRRIIEGLLGSAGTIVPAPVRKAFETELAMKQAAGKLRTGTDVHIALGHATISRYLGEGDPEESRRGVRAIREAISTLKQSARYDDIVEEMVRKHPPPDRWQAIESKNVVKDKPKVKRQRTLDERTANVFPNDHQFHAFREAITTKAAQQAIPVNQQLALAKEIMKAPKNPTGGISTKKQIGAPYIKMRVQTVVQEGLKKQREINQEEREAYLREQAEERIDSEVHNANRSLR